MPTNMREYSRIYYLKNKEKMRDTYLQKTGARVMCEGCGKMIKEAFLNDHLKSAYHVRHSGRLAPPQEPEEKKKLLETAEELTAKARADLEEADKLKVQVTDLIAKMNLLRETSKQALLKAKEIEMMV